jgi:hypothetical protein
MTPRQRAITEDLRAYECLEENLRKQLAAYTDYNDRVGLIHLVQQYYRTLNIITELQEMIDT